MAEEAPTLPEETTTTDRGQAVVRVRRRKKGGEAPKEKEIDAVVQKHLERTEEIYGADAAVPPEEDDPGKRDRPTVSEVVLTPEAFPEGEELPEHVAAAEQAEEELLPPDLSDNKYRGLEDLNAMFRFDGSGQYFIAVTRIQPKIHAGVACYGRQQNIKEMLSYMDFAERYGGGTYELIAYGPPARGKMIDANGRPIPKALTRPIRLTIPWQGAGGYEPNPMSAIEEDDAEAPDMRRGPFDKAIDLPEALLGRRGNTLAEANMYARHMEHQETMDDRRRQDAKEARERRQQEEQTLVGVVAQTKDQTIEMLREELNEIKREHKNGHNKNGTDMAGLAQVLSSVRGPGASAEELERTRQTYEQQIRDLRETHAQRITDSEERSRREREDLTSRLSREKDDAIRRADTEVERANARLGELERRLTHERDQERESARREAERVQTAHDRHLEALAREHQRDIDTIKAQYDARIGALQDRMASEARLLQQVHENVKQVEKTTVEAQLRGTESELRRAEAEIIRLKADLDKKGNLPKLLEEQDKVAAALGYIKESDAPSGGEEADTKTMLLRGAVALAQNLPEIIKQAGTSIALARGGQGGPPPQQRMLPPPGFPPMMMPPPPQRPPVTQAGPVQGYLPDEAGLQPPPLPPAYQVPQTAMVPAIASMPAPPSPLPPLERPPSLVAEPPPTAPPPAMQPTTPPSAGMAEGRPSMPAPRPSAPPPRPGMPPPVAATAEAAGIPISDADIVKFAPDLEAVFGRAVKGQTVEELAALAVSINPGITLVAPSLTPERISTALRANGLHTSPLIRRDGQRFLRDFRDAVLRVGVASPA